MYKGLLILIICLSVLFSIETSAQAQNGNGKSGSGNGKTVADNPFKEKCDTCHSNLVQYKEWLKSPHTKALKTLQEDPKSRNSCLSCHSSGYSDLTISWGGGRTEKPTLETAQNAISCSSCHSHASTKPKLLVMQPEMLCVSCHKMDCGCAGAGIIHQAQAELYLGRSGAGVKSTPSVHNKLIEKRCVGCHMHRSEENVILEAGGHTFRADTKLCATCHFDLEEKVATSRREVEAFMKQIKEMLDAAQDQNSQAYKDAKLNYDMVKGDHGKNNIYGYGSHNPTYAKELLKYALSLKPLIK